MYKPNPVILREYDIRGTFGENLFEADATWLGEKFASLMLEGGLTRVVVCRDGRKSSPILHQALCSALVNCGAQILDIGIGPTPMSYFAGYELEADATLMITGSHNPKDDNGIKITISNKPFFGSQIQDLVNQKVTKNAAGSYTSIETIFDKYVQRLTKSNSFKKPLKIAWDSGNGATGPAVKALSAALSQHQHILLFTDIDCDFPNHHPDPSVPENLTHLVEAVKQNNCDIGFAFDGDGDRVGVVDSTGRILAGDELVTILSEAILQESPGGTIIADVKCSNHTFRAITEAGGNAIMGRTGHSWVKRAMVENNALFAGEMSGHMFFKHNYYGFDDGLYAAIFLINYIQKLDSDFADLVSNLPKTYSTPELRIMCGESEKLEIINSLKDKLKKSNKPFNDIDGVRVEETNGWWLVRASNTQSALIIRAEGNTENALTSILATMNEFGISTTLVKH